VATRFRDQLCDVWKDIRSGAVGYVLTAIAGSSLLVFFRRWLSAEHTMTLTGWCWTALALLCLLSIGAAGTSAIRKFTSKKTRERSRDERDIKILLSKYLADQKPAESFEWVELGPLKYHELDQMLSLKPGSASRYLGEVAEANGWKIVSQGKGVVTIRYGDRYWLSMGSEEDLY
jgi:hypothetical protein